MTANIHVVAPDATDPASEGTQLWDAVVDLTVAWLDALRMGDADGAGRGEAELRFFALYYVAQPSEGAAVILGRKAIIRSVYAEHGGSDTGLVRTMIDAVIAREEAEALRDPPGTPSATTDR